MIVTFGSVLIFFGSYNIYCYLIKQKKYKVWANVGLYVSALLCISLNIAFALTVPFDNYCTCVWFITAYTAAYCNLVMGLIQAYLLSTLKTQL